MSGRGLERYLAYMVHGRTEHAKRPRRKTRRGPARNWKYRAWIRTLPSVVSGRMGCEACHTVNNGMCSKGSCYSCVPLTRDEHQEYDAGRENFERKYGVKMTDIVRGLNRAFFSHIGGDA